MKKTINILAIAASLAFANYGYGQENQRPAALKNILNLAGQWQGPATMKMDGKEAHFTYYADFKKVADGNGLTMHEWCDIPGMGKMDGGNLIGYDANDGKIHWYSVDNMGTTHEHIGEFKDPSHYTMVHKSMHDGKAYVETVELVWLSKDKLSLHLSGVTDGKEDEAISAVFTRKGGKSNGSKS